MGAEIRCNAEYNGQTGKGTAMLETDHVLFRGDYRVKILFRDIVSLSVDAEALVVLTEQGQLRLELGPAAKLWKQKIENPPSLLSKLGVKPGLSIAAVNVQDGGFLAQIGPEAGTDPVDLLFLGAEQIEELAGISKAARRIAQDGAVWVIYPKGQRHIREIDVLNAGRAAGLKDVKVAGFSPTHTALKFVIPVANRRKELA